MGLVESGPVDDRKLLDNDQQHRPSKYQFDSFSIEIQLAETNLLKRFEF